jgi:hypothetical protein
MKTRQFPDALRRARRLIVRCGESSAPLNFIFVAFARTGFRSLGRAIGPSRPVAGLEKSTSTRPSRSRPNIALQLTSGLVVARLRARRLLNWSLAAHRGR